MRVATGVNPGLMGALGQDGRGKQFLYGAATDPPSVLQPGQRHAIGAVTAVLNGEEMPVCTATVVDEAIAITAAHCQRFGQLRYRFDPAGPSRPVTGLVEHPSLDVMAFDVTWTPDGSPAAPIPLLESGIDEEWIGTQLTLAGVGRTEQQTTGELRFVSEAVVHITEDEIWVDGMGRSGACGGDSGGPLLLQTRHGVFVAGTLDRGSTDCLGRDVYVRADRLVTWLRDFKRALPGDDPCNAEP